MRESSSVAAVPADGMPGLPGPGARSAGGPAASTAAGSAEMMLRLADDHDRIARRPNEIVTRRLFSAAGPVRWRLAGAAQHREQG